MLVLITGADGFIGSHLGPFLAKRGHTVVGATADVTDRAAITTEIERSAPAIIVHLAAVSHVPTCERDPERARAVNVEGTANVLAAAAGARLVFPSSAHVYRPAELLDEDSPLEPTTVYARTKVSSEEQIGASGQPATVLRLFNHTHRSQSPEFFLPRIYHALAKQAGTGAKVAIPVGNTKVARDFGSIQDLLVAFAAVIERTEPPVHEVLNVCTGIAKPLRVLVEALGERLRVIAELVADPARMRVGEPATMCGSHARLTAAAGWHPTALTADAVVDAFLTDLV